ncbi:glycerophosphodiester phosphodiesterase family protein [Saccharothrix xinjiangensis]|uniref:Glycerophosphodiester phosphodiesterase family protein n=1 Tax=Saccharothrix xinjiangensis TaxID=204798 RepID=A0ABV9Y511_9PSEU
MTATHPYLTGPHPRAYAHRGWHLDELAGMENSLSAFTRASREGFRYLETDVHATSDGVVVVHHDAVLDRTTDRVGAVAGQPWSVVSGARVGGREPIARLEDLLEELPEALLNIDVKADAAVEPVLGVLRRTGALGRVCLASFSDRRLARLRRLGGPGLLTSMGPRNVGALWAAGRLRVANLPVRGMIAQVPAVQGRLRVVDGRFVRAAHRRGLEVHVWTIDEEPVMRALLDLGVDGLVTDRPDRLREVLASRGAWTS